jgi:hypothetical protein
MIRNKRIKELEQKVFEMEALIGILEIRLNDLMQSQDIVWHLDSEKWYSKPIDK